MRGLIRRVRAGARIDGRILSVRGLSQFYAGLDYAARICQWCNESLDDEPRRRYRHSECMIWRDAAESRVDPYQAFKRRPPPYNGTREEWDEYYRDAKGRSVCVDCGKTPGRMDRGLEIDHELPISVAAELGPEAVMRCFTPDNVRYLCHDCHVEKTKRDRVILKILRTGIEPPPPPPPPPFLPLFPDL